MSDVKSSIDRAVRFLRPTANTLKLVELLTYPLNLNLDKSRLDTFYDCHLVDLIKSLFRTYLLKRDLTLLNIIKQSCHICKPEVWLLCAVEELKAANELSDIRFIIQLIEDFIFKYRRLSHILSDVSESCTACVLPQITDNISRLISSLPVIVANSTRERFRSQLMDTENYIKVVLSSFDSVLLEKPGYVEICSSIISQLTISGFSSAISTIVIQDLQITAFSKNCSIWSSLLPHIKEKCLESFMQPILLNSPNTELVKLLLSKEFSTIQLCSFSRYLRLYRRLLFVRYFPKGDIVRNIFNPLSVLLLSNSDHEIATNIANLVNQELGLPALRLWADTMAIASTSVQQRVYTSQILASWITDFYLPILRNTVPVRLKLMANAEALIPDILSGISNHLQSTRQEIRVLGMAVGEWLIQKLNFALPTASQEHQLELKFDYEETDVLQLVRPFFTSPSPGSFAKTNDDSTLKEVDLSCTTPEALKAPIQDDLDSDDDPDPGGASFPRLPSLECQNKGTKIIGDIPKIRKPRYLRECLDGLMLAKPEDSHVNLACTAAAADLIYAHPNAAKELVHEFARALLHIDPPVSPNDGKVEADRHSALVALGVVAPKQCARYLTSEFGQSNLSIGQRSRILSVLTYICCQLSSIKTVEASCSPNKEPRVGNIAVLPERLEVKTRRFFSKRLPSKPTQQNLFSKVCGDFFFPLLQNISQLFMASGPFAHQDTTLLANLIAYLATVYACSRFSSVQDRMASELMTSLPSLYRHTDCAVRRAVLIAIGTMVTMTPDVLFRTNPNILLWRSTELTPTTMLLSPTDKARTSSSSLVEWIKWCMSEDTDSECQLLAQVCLSAVADRLANLSTM